MGLILVYRTTRIVNFAYGAMGAMPGSITVGLFTAKGWNYWLAIAVGVVVGIVIGRGHRDPRDPALRAVVAPRAHGGLASGSPRCSAPSASASASPSAPTPLIGNIETPRQRRRLRAARTPSAATTCS